MFNIFSILWVFLFNAIIVFFTNRKFEKNTPLVFILGVFFLYICGLFGNLIVGFYLLNILIAVSFAYMIFSIIRNTEKKKQFMSNYFTIGAIVYFLLFAFILYSNQNRGFELCDEFMHWGPMTKEMYRLNRFYCVAESKLLVHKDYPPFFSLLELLFCYIGGRYKEEYLYVGLQAFIGSLLVGIYSEYSIKEKNVVKKIFPTVFSMILVCFVVKQLQTTYDNAYLFNSIYVDWPLSFISAYTVSYIISTNEWGTYDLIYLTLLMMATTLTKQIGLYFVGIALMFFAFNLIFNKKQKVKFAKTVMPAGLSLIVLATWKLLIRHFNYVGQFDSSNFSLTLTPDKIIVIKRFVLNIFKRGIVGGAVSLSYFVALVVISAIIYLSLGRDKKSTLSASMYFIFGLGYALAMLFLYTFAFSLEEALELASFDRYMMCYLYFGICMFVFSFYKRKNDIQVFTNVIFIMVLVMLFTDFETVPINFKKADYDFKIMYIERYDDGERFTRDQNLGVNLTLEHYDSAFEVENDYDIINESFVNELKKNDYLYIKNYDNPFFYFWINSSQSEDIEVGDLYRIVKSNEGLYLEKDNYSPVYFMTKYYLMEE